MKATFQINDQTTLLLTQTNMRSTFRQWLMCPVAIKGAQYLFYYIGQKQYFFYLYLPNKIQNVLLFSVIHNKGKHNNLRIQNKQTK